MNKEQRTMSTEHAPGPWQKVHKLLVNSYGEFACGCHLLTLTSDGMKGIEFCPTHYAAPAMLDTLKCVERTIREDLAQDDTLDGCLMVLQIAIAEAEKGEW
jgi:hypothetical protein